MPKLKFKATPEESRRMMLAAIIPGLGGLIFVLSALALVKTHVGWSCAGIGVGIAVCLFGNVKIFVVAQQVKAAHQNDESN